MLNFSYATKTDIPKGAEAFYEEKDGAFHLKVEGAIPETFSSPLKKALDDERKLRRDAEAKAKTLNDKFGLLPEDFDINEFNRLKDSDPSKELDSKLAEQRDRINKQWETRLADKDKALSEKDGLIQKHVKDSALSKAIAEVNIGKAFVPAVAAMFKEQITLEGENVLLKDRPVAEFMKEWAASEEGKAFVSATVNSGGGAEGKSGSGAKREMKSSEFNALPAKEQASLMNSGNLKLID